MTIGTILVPLTGGAEDVAGLATAFAFAKPFGAHVGALCVTTDARDVAGEEDLRVPIPERARRGAGRRERARDIFETVANAAGVPIVDGIGCPGATGASFEPAIGRLSDVIAARARFADLIVFGPLREAPDMRAAFAHVLMHAQRPVLLAGATAAREPCRRIAIAWDGSLVAARALTSAVPILKIARDVVLLTAGEVGAIGAQEAILYLALQAIRASARRLEGRPPGPALLEAAKDFDLLVCGGYGHSRALEGVLGGVTASVLDHAERPVLMAH